LVQGEANAIAPGKRPLSSMPPTIVRKDGHVYLVTGSPGGSTIPNTVLFVVTGVIDEHMAITQAVEQPRIHHQWLPDQITYEPDGLSSDVISALEAKGHLVAKRNVYGGDLA
jgi:gamma-glutamyltranspeptidase / glutathione hydrolase